MRILVTGIYEPEYNRNLVLLTGLRKKNIELTEYPYLYRTARVKRELIQLSKNADLIFLPSFTHLDVPFIKSFLDLPLIFDPLVSRYLSKVFDYRTVWKFSPRAYRNYLKDKVSFQMSDLIISDTRANKNYYMDKFRIKEDKIFILPVGMIKDDFYPMENNNAKEGDAFIVGFYGSFIPLHGMDKIIETARILQNHKNIKFRIYGDGHGFREILKAREREGLDNLSLEGWAPYEGINRLINQFDLCLGVFGDSLKTDLVIPNKVFHYSASGKPTLTKDTEGIREIFEDGETILLCQNDPVEMAEVILRLEKERNRLVKIGAAARELVISNYNEDILAGIFLKQANKLVENQRKKNHTRGN